MTAGVSATLSAAVPTQTQWPSGSQYATTVAIGAPGNRTLTPVTLTAGSATVTGNFASGDASSTITDQITYGVNRTRFTDPGNTGLTNPYLDTRTQSPSSVTSDRSYLIYARGGSAKWRAGLNCSAANVDSFDITDGSGNLRLQVTSTAVSVASNKITGVANGSAASDAAAFGQVPAAPSAANFGMTGWTTDPGGTAVAAISVATHYVFKIFVAGAKPVGNVLLHNNIAGSGSATPTSPCHNSAGNLISGTQSADLSATWTAAAGNKTFALGATSTVTDDFVYVSMWVNAASTTIPQIARATSIIAGNLGTVTGVSSATSPRWGTAANAYTSSGTVAPSSLGTISVATACWVIGVT